MNIRNENKGKRFFSKGMVTACMLLALVLVFPSNAEAAKLNKKTITLLKGKTSTLIVKGTNKKAVWKMSRNGVVRFTAKKNTSIKVRAVRPGQTTVSAKIGKKTYKCKVRVVNPKLSSKSINLTVGETKLLKVQDGTGTIKWQTNNASVAAANKGRVTAKKAGAAKITAVCNGKRMFCMVNVRRKAPSKNEGNNSTKPDQPQGKKVWVVTKEAWIEQRSIYTNIRSEWECTCGFKTEDSGAFDIHGKNHLSNGEPSAWRVNTLKDFSHVETIEHPEEGYWKYI